MHWFGDEEMTHIRTCICSRALSLSLCGVSVYWVSRPCIFGRTFYSLTLSLYNAHGFLSLFEGATQSNPLPLSLSAPHRPMHHTLFLSLFRHLTDPYTQA
ncbi:hypothetical protein CsSME_00039112 [Camellia sinensis var. sinensis]